MAHITDKSTLYVIRMPTNDTRLSLQHLIISFHLHHESNRGTSGLHCHTNKRIHSIPNTNAGFLSMLVWLQKQMINKLSPLICTKSIPSNNSNGAATRYYIAYSNATKSARLLVLHCSLTSPTAAYSEPSTWYSMKPIQFLPPSKWTTRLCPSWHCNVSLSSLGLLMSLVAWLQTAARQCFFKKADSA